MLGLPPLSAYGHNISIGALRIKRLEMSYEGPYGFRLVGGLGPDAVSAKNSIPNLGVLKFIRINLGSLPSFLSSSIIYVSSSFLPSFLLPIISMY